MMKRLFSLCLAMVMALSLAACGSSKTPTTSSSSTPATGSADSSVEPTSVGHPAFHTGGGSRRAQTAEDGTEVLISKSTTYDIVYPEECDAQKAIQKDLDQVKANFHKEAGKQTEEAQDYYQEFLKSGGKKEDFTPYTSELTCKPLRADNGVVSILFYSYAYNGGAHGSLTTFARNYDAKTGKVLTMKDFGEEVSTLVTDNAVKFINAIQDTDDAFFYDKVKAEDESVQSMLETGSFYLSKDGLVLIDGQYLLQPYAAGIVEFTTSYDDLRGKLNDEYTLDSGVTNCVSAMGTYSFDQDGKLTKTESTYDPADMPKGEEMPEVEDSDASASNR